MVNKNNQRYKESAVIINNRLKHMVTNQMSGFF